MAAHRSHSTYAAASNKATFSLDLSFLCFWKIMARDTQTQPVITIDGYKRDVVCQFTYFGSENNANLSCSSEDSSVGKLRAVGEDKIWQYAMPVHCCMTAIYARQDRILSSSTNHLMRHPSYPGQIMTRKMSKVDSMYCASIPLCARCSDNADCDGWVKYVTPALVSLAQATRCFSRTSG